MTRRLLADRFGLVIKAQTKTLPIYRLVLARNDNKQFPKGLTPESCDVKEPLCAGVAMGPNLLTGVMSIPRLAKAITQGATYTTSNELSSMTPDCPARTAFICSSPRLANTSDYE